MALIDFNRQPSKSELFWFGALFVIFFTGLGFFLVWNSSSVAAYSVWALAAGVGIVFFSVPATRRPIYLGWMYAALPLGWVVSTVLLGFTFYFVLTPIGLALRAFGRCPLERGPDLQRLSYWEERPPLKDRGRYFRQF